MQRVVFQALVGHFEGSDLCQMKRLSNPHLHAEVNPRNISNQL